MLILLIYQQKLFDCVAPGGRGMSLAIKESDKSDTTMKNEAVHNYKNRMRSIAKILKASR